MSAMYEKLNISREPDSPEQLSALRALLAAGKSVSYAEVASNHGHDAFLMNIPYYHRLLGGYLRRVADAGGAA